MNTLYAVVLRRVDASAITFILSSSDTLADHLHDLRDIPAIQRFVHAANPARVIDSGSLGALMGEAKVIALPNVQLLAGFCDVVTHDFLGLMRALGLETPIIPLRWDKGTLWT